jgi:hypothetical protein
MAEQFGLRGIVLDRSTRALEIGEDAASAAAVGDEPIDGGGPVLAHIRLHIVYWGNSWDQHVPLIAGIDAAARAILSGNYVTLLSEYRADIGVGSVVTSQVLHRTDPGSGFTESDVRMLLSDVFDSGELSLPQQTDDAYLVFSPPGVRLPGILGAHTVMDDYISPNGARPMIYFGWITEPASTLDGYTCTLAHEIVEMITDPHFDGIHFPVAPQMNDVREIADLCPDCYRRNDGTTVQAWYSRQSGGCIQPM